MSYYTNQSRFEDSILDNIFTMGELKYETNKFIENTYNKVRQLRELCNRKNPQCLIEVDGGVNTGNAPKLFEAGADVLVAGNAVFKSENPMQTIIDLKR